MCCIPFHGLLLCGVVCGWDDWRARLGGWFWSSCGFDQGRLDAWPLMLVGAF
jgi:hypothetical protein